MRAMIKAAVAAAALLTAAPVLALTPQSTPTRAGTAALRFLSSGPDSSGLQDSVVGGGLRTDGRSDFSGDGSVSLGYLLTAEPKDHAKSAVRYFEDDLATSRTPGVTVYHAPAAPAPQGK
jgi:hypothetical protein